MLAAYSFNKVYLAFDSHCILDAEVLIKSIKLPQEIDESASKSSASSTSTNNSESLSTTTSPTLPTMFTEYLNTKFPNMTQDEINYVAYRELIKVLIN